MSAVDTLPTGLRFVVIDASSIQAPGAKGTDHRLHIDPGWGEQKVFRHYRAALLDQHKHGTGNPTEIGRFREANAALEAFCSLSYGSRGRLYFSATGRSTASDCMSFACVARNSSASLMAWLFCAS